MTMWRDVRLFVYMLRCVGFVRVWLVRWRDVLGLNLPAGRGQVARTGPVCPGKGRRRLPHVLGHPYH